MKRLIVDLDGTITLHSKESYQNSIPNIELIEKLREYRLQGYEIAISTSRNMNTHKGNIGRINALTLPVIIEWLNKHNVPYDEIYTGKPWCGHEGFYIDDRAIRPDEFVKLSPEEINAIIDKKE